MFVKRSTEFWAPNVQTQLQALGIILIAAFFLPWIVAGEDEIDDLYRAADIYDADPGSVLFSWDTATVFDGLEDEIRASGRHARRGDRDRARALRDFSFPSTLSPTFILILGLIAVVLGFTPQISMLFKIPVALAVLLTWLVAGGVGMNELFALDMEHHQLVSRLFLLGWGALFMGVSGRLLAFKIRNRWAVLGLSSVGAAMVVLGNLIPVKIGQQSKPMLVWLFKGLGEDMEGWWFVFMAVIVLFLGLGLIQVTMSIRVLVTRIRPSAEYGSWLAGITVGLFALTTIVPAILFSALIEQGAFLVGVYFSAISAILIVWVLGFVALAVGAVTEAVFELTPKKKEPGNTYWGW